MTALELLSRADIHPGNAHRDNVELRRQQGYKRETELVADWGKDKCHCCGRMFDTRSLRWINRTKRISLECQLQNEKDARRMRARNARGAT